MNCAMKTLLVGMDWFPNRPGGLNRYFYEAVHALPRTNVQGHALVSSILPGQSAPFCLSGMAPPDASLRERLRGAKAQVNHSLHEGVDIINAHFALYAYPWVGSLPPRMPLVVNFQGPWADEIMTEAPSLAGRTKGLLARAIECKVYRRAQRVITLSDAFAAIAHERYGVDKARIRCIPGAVNLDPYLSAPATKLARERLGWPLDRPTLVCVRRLARRMGLEGLIDAVELVRRAVPNVLLLIGGKGAIHDELQSRIDAKNLSDNVRLLGFVPDDKLPLAYAAADLSVVPTVSLEGFGLITVESLASGTPVMATPVGGLPEILTPLSSDLIFTSPTTEALADGLVKALKGAINLPASQECREYAHRYGWPAVAPRVRAVFEEAANA
jgi:glycosyltransferase involved in cell wall biosynthesis